MQIVPLLPDGLVLVVPVDGRSHLVVEAAGDDGGPDQHGREHGGDLRDGQEGGQAAVDHDEGAGLGGGEDEPARGQQEGEYADVHQGHWKDTEKDIFEPQLVKS